jgi:hypothetical protein
MTVAETRRETKRTIEAAESAILQPAEETERIGRSQMEAGQQAAQAGVDLLRTNVQVVQRTLESTMELLSEIAERNAKGYLRLFGTTSDRAQQATQQSSRNVEAMFAVTGTVSELWGEWISFAQKRARQNLDHFSSLMSCRTSQEVLAAQNELVRDNVEDLLQRGRRMAERSMQVSENAGRRMAENADDISHPA